MRGFLLSIIAIAAGCSRSPSAPLAIVYLHQCDRALGFVGVDVVGNVHILDATELTPEQLKNVANTVPVNRYKTMDVPCVSHHKDSLPQSY